MGFRRESARVWVRTPKLSSLEHMHCEVRGFLRARQMLSASIKSNLRMRLRLIAILPTPAGVCDGSFNDDTMPQYTHACCFRGFLAIESLRIQCSKIKIGGPQHCHPQALQKAGLPQQIVWIIHPSRDLLTIEEEPTLIPSSKICAGAPPNTKVLAL